MTTAGQLEGPALDTVGACRCLGHESEVIEGGPSLAAQLAWFTVRLTVRPALALASYLPNLPWPFGLADFSARALARVPGSVGTTIRLSQCSARLVRAAGVADVDGAGRVVLYMHGGAFLGGGANTHNRLVTALSGYADAPVLVVNYRMLPHHSIRDAINDCHDGYRWLRGQGYRPDQIVLAGDSAGGYLSLTLAEELLGDGERPAAMVCMAPLMQIDQHPKQAHPNIRTGAMFPAKAFDALAALIAKAVEHQGQSEIYEPLDHIEPGLPPTLIHVSSSEVLLYDARVAARRLAAAGVPVEVRIWPGQIHVFQLAAPAVPEATRSLRQIGAYIRAMANPDHATAA